MSAIFSAPIWLLFLSFALPMFIVGSHAFAWNRAFPNAGMPRRHVTVTDQQGRLIATAHQDSQSGVVFYFGPLAIAANARAWAAVTVMTGLLLTGIGMVGLLHFPTQWPKVRSESITSGIENGEGISNDSLNAEQ